METKRPTVPAAEEILGAYFPVLDHGFVSLVDYMGSDEDVERAARVSYGFGTRKVSQTRGLVRYLRRHHHTTPSEMVEFKFHCAMPMFVARQWIRHRTACLAEGTEVYFDLPGGVDRRGNQLYKLRIEDIWQRFQPTENRTRPDKQRNPYFRRDRVREMLLRQVNEDTTELQHTRVVDVFKNGKKPVFKVVLEDGKSIEATADHKFLFAEGWNTLRGATGLREANGRAVWLTGDYMVHVNGAAREVPAMYQDPIWLQREYRGHRRSVGELADICGVSYHTIRKWLGRYRLTEPGRGDFREGNTPWNRGLTYRTGPKELSADALEAVRAARSGSASNFWKGGVSTERESIGRWTTQVAPKVHAANGWTCQLCHQRNGELHCHHVVPVWADPDLARDLTNLTTLCGDCHRSIQGRELEVVEALGGPPVKEEWKPRPRTAWNRLETSRLVRVERFEYVGERETYDLEVEGPYHNFVANGIVTHNSVNELSARYSLMPLLFYTPPQEQFALQSRSNNQGREEGAPPEVYREAVDRWERMRAEAGDAYGWMLEQDVARELARIDLPVSTYTQWYWKIDLHNLLHFLTLRVDARAQWEIQQFARVIAGMVKRVAPLSYEAWVDYDLESRPLTRGDRIVLAKLVEADAEGVRARAGGLVTPDDLTEAGLSKREVAELAEKLQNPGHPDFELDLSSMKTADEIAAKMYKAVPSTFE
ncbi:MAG TPA: FAD-dependent thymidylate synthase [Longimicrobiales bacterium]|nr:FAD-dependent thymidylate synthase [Longimicrobiales bacterium]